MPLKGNVHPPKTLNQDPSSHTIASAHYRISGMTDGPPTTVLTNMNVNGLNQDIHSINNVMAETGIDEQDSVYSIPSVITSRQFKNCPDSRGRTLSNLKTIPCTMGKTVLPTLFCANTRSARYKMNDLCASVRHHQSDIVCVVESWFNDSLDDQHLSLGPEYTLPFRHDRTNRIGGGVAAWLHKSLQFKHWLELNDDNFETLWLTVWSSKMPRKFSHIILGVIYHTATSTEGHRSLCNHIISCIDHIKRHHSYSGILLVGDFNMFPNHLLINQLKLKQIIKRPTRGTAILDKCFTDMDPFYSEFVIVPPISSSDHNAFVCYPSCNSSYDKGHVKMFTTRVQGQNERTLFYHAVCNVRWEPLYRMQSHEEKLAFFNSTISELMEHHFPVKVVKRHTNDKPWVTDHFKSLVSQRQIAFMRGDMTTYRLFRNKVNRMCPKLESNFYNNKVAKLKDSDSKNWWRNMKELLGLSNKRGPLDSLANAECDGDQSILANRINNFFASVGNHLSSISDDNEYISGSFPVSDMYLLQVDDMEKCLAAVKTNKATGPDGIPGWVLRDLSHVLAGPLTAIANASIQEGNVAADWKFALVSPLPKIPAPKDIKSDLRPISITSIAGKAVEHFPVQWMYRAIQNKIDENQFGGVKDSSTAFALLKIMDYIAKNTDNSGIYVRMLLVDFAKAFDLVDHNIVLNKLNHLGVDNCLIKWTASFLKDREQSVRINHTVSAPANINAGCPQGTLMGPLVFLAHINDLSPVEPVLTIKYVDDTNVLHASSDPMDATMQNVAEYLSSWSLENKMRFNAAKSKEIIFCFAQSVPDFTPIEIGGNVIQRVDEAKILGVTISSDLKWTKHVNNLLKKANKRLYLLTLCRRAGLSTGDMLCIYTSIVRSILEYCAVVWHTNLPNYLSDAIENVQKRALYTIYGSKDYSECLELSDLKPLWRRRDEQCRRLYDDMKAPSHKLHNLLPTARDRHYDIRDFNPFNSISCQTNRYAKSFIPYCTKHF